jgi:hypothetical protein
VPMMAEMDEMSKPNLVISVVAHDDENNDK